MGKWQIEFYSDFLEEFENLSENVQDALLSALIPLRELGHSLGRPNADTLIGSKHANMKELRFSANNGVWRVAFAFDPERKAVLLVAGNKAGVNQKRFYKQLIIRADDRYGKHLQSLLEK